MLLLTKERDLRTCQICFGTEFVGVGFNIQRWKLRVAIIVSEEMPSWYAEEMTL